MIFQDLATQFCVLLLYRAKAKCFLFVESCRKRDCVSVEEGGGYEQPEYSGIAQ